MQTTVDKYSCDRLLWINIFAADYCGQTRLWQTTVDKYSCDRLLWTITVLADYCGQISCRRLLWTNIVAADYCGQIQLWQTTVNKYSCGRLLWTSVPAHQQSWLTCHVIHSSVSRNTTVCPTRTLRSTLPHISCDASK